MFFKNGLKFKLPGNSFIYDLVCLTEMTHNLHLPEKQVFNVA